MPVMRYPGGNFVSGYNWLDGVGPKKQRPAVLERAWNSLETNQFGTNEFIDWCKLVATEPLLAFNLGTGTPETAVAYVEYCNVDKGTKWSELRRSHGYDAPHNVRYWCLGNEMDGPWQMGHMSAREYGQKARDAARQIRVIDRDLQLIACGSSNPNMPTYLVWDREVLEECYDQVDAISLHNYYGNTPPLTGNSSARFLAMNLDMERQIREIAAVADYVQGLRKSPKRLWLSFDEWNVWYRARERRLRRRQARVCAEAARGSLQPRGRAARRRFSQHAAAAVRPRPRRVPRADPQRHRAPRDQRDVRPSAEHLLSVCVGAAIRAWPRSWTCSSNPRPIRSRQPACERMSRAMIRCRSSTWPPHSIKPNGRACVLMLNRDLESERELVLDWRDLTPTRVLACETLTGGDLKAFNTFAEPKRVVPRKLDPPSAGGTDDLQASSPFVLGGSRRDPLNLSRIRGSSSTVAATFPLTA